MHCDNEDNKLVRNGANVNYRNKVNYTPLMYACIKGDLNLVKLLLDNGADINAVNHKKIIHYILP
ncbi:ankyrin repeat domain-containing protein [Brachyspira intermedia]|uniref:ankyrin repeat domain-containing protein n=1 Tax=Brachyspira intermedia TaxID=84377 RepID=UPI003B5A9CE6